MQYCWNASYEIETVRGTQTYTIDGTETKTCPVATITAESKTLIVEIYAAKTLKDAGGILYGPDAGRWPARWADAVRVFEYEEIIVQNERTKALNDEAKFNFMQSQAKKR